MDSAVFSRSNYADPGKFSRQKGTPLPVILKSDVELTLDCSMESAVQNTLPLSISSFTLRDQESGRCFYRWIDRQIAAEEASGKI
jgi:hypothetical protein